MRSEKDDESLITYAEVAKMLNLKHSAIKALMERGMPHYQLTSKMVRFQRKKILAWLEMESKNYKDKRQKNKKDDNENE